MDPQSSTQPSATAEAGAIRELGADVVEFTVAETDPIVGRRIRELELPRDALVSLVIREREAVPPRGSTPIQPHDHLHVVVRRESAADIDRLFERWRGDS